MFENGFETMQILVPIVFLVVIGIILTMAVKGIIVWNKNNHSPRLTVDAVIVSKREDVSGHSHNMVGNSTGIHGYHTYTSYYVTFQFDSGDRLEFSIEGTEYGMLAEGDRGKLTFQGTRYLGFERTV